MLNTSRLGIEACCPARETAIDASACFASIKGRMSDLDRDPDECRILFGIQPIIGATLADAREKQEEHNALVPVEGGMAILSAHLEFDLVKLPPDAIIAECTEPEPHRFRTRFLKADGTPMTVAQVAARHDQSVGIRKLVARRPASRTRWRCSWRRSVATDS